MKLSAVPLVLLGTFSVEVVEVEARLDHYAGYLPTEPVTDLAAIDLDQYEINEQLSDRKITNAMHVYLEGGHSASYAVLSLQNIGKPSNSFPAGTKVFGVNNKDEEVSGWLLEDVSWPQDTVDLVSLKVKYFVEDQQRTYSDCQVGGLWRFSEANREGCFADLGTVRLVQDGESEIGGTEFEYSYDTRHDNNNMRSLYSLSTDAVDSMKISGRYFDEYKTFVNYYGNYNYADKWITAASKKIPTNFKSGRGDSDFSQLTEHLGQGEAIKKGAAYLTIWMEVVKHLSMAVDQCGEQFAALHVDEAVALYTGSLTTLPDESGILLYGLAHVRAHQFRTAGHDGDKDEGNALVNNRIMEGFKKLQGLLEAEDDGLCRDVHDLRDAIVDWMKVPLIQGTLRYTYIVDQELPDDPDNQERARAEVATFAATVLPFVHECDAHSAKILHANTKLGSKTEFQAVKRALERTYGCLRVDCAAVGGIWDRDAQEFLEGGEPCASNIRRSHPIAAFGRFLGITTGIILAGWLVIRYRHTLLRLRRRKQMHTTTSFSGNIAAVAEIS